MKGKGSLGKNNPTPMTKPRKVIKEEIETWGEKKGILGKRAQVVPEIKGPKERKGEDTEGP